MFLTEEFKPEKFKPREFFDFFQMLKLIVLLSSIFIIFCVVVCIRTKHPIYWIETGELPG
jgi:lipopolysaccharide/colanic/teichoic acid biosynthesis glycosyltransferase